jgi:hypothetical protein
MSRSQERALKWESLPLTLLDENALVRPKPLKADLGEYVNTQVVGKRGSRYPVDALHNM